jgi:hypothetical protein
MRVPSGDHTGALSEPAFCEVSCWRPEPSALATKILNGSPGAVRAA